jgi:excisionase family DNA binding protein
LPEAVALILEKINRIDALLKNYTSDAKTTEAPKEVMPIKEAASFLNASVSFMYKRVMDRDIPFYKVGNRLYFKREELLGYVLKNRNKTRDEIDQEARIHLSKVANKKRAYR